MLWVTVALKLVAAISGWWPSSGIGGYARRTAERRAERPGPPALILVFYGGVLTVVGLLVQLDLVHAAANADHKALRWHACLWDPWFLVWGVLLAAALARSRVARCEQGPGRCRSAHAR